MPSDSEGLWPKLPDAAAPVVDEDREIDDVDDVPDEEFLIDDEEPGIDADDRIAPADDDLVVDDDVDYDGVDYNDER